MTFQYIHLETDYNSAEKAQEEALKGVINNNCEKILFLKLDDIYTAGTSANIKTDYKDTSIPLIQTGRGGQITYHGPGQIVAYPIINLNNRNKDLRKYINSLQNIIIRTLAHFNIIAYTNDDVGVWVKNSQNKEEKIAAIGIRVRKWVTFHGIALNVNTELSKFNGIVPCGISDKNPTSMQKILNSKIDIKQVEDALKKEFEKEFF